MISCILWIVRNLRWRAVELGLCEEGFRSCDVRRGGERFSDLLVAGPNVGGSTA